MATAEAMRSTLQPPSAGSLVCGRLYCSPKPAAAMQTKCCPAIVQGCATETCVWAVGWSWHMRIVLMPTTVLDPKQQRQQHRTGDCSQDGASAPAARSIVAYRPSGMAGTAASAHGAALPRLNDIERTSLEHPSQPRGGGSDRILGNHALQKAGWRQSSMIAFRHR